MRVEKSQKTPDKRRQHNDAFSACVLRLASKSRRTQAAAQLNEHLAVRLKTLRGLIPHEFIWAQHQKNPTIFTRDPTRLILGLHT